ncbi:MAG: dethiobiotin synthase [Deltaproteobacteria bacterium]|nr:dethiobiotin synthase [Deltaproteobacteria bacterium]
MAWVTDYLDLINPYRFKAPLAPSIASREVGQTIDLDKIKGCYETLSSRHEVMLVEGVGGIVVPLNEKETMTDLIKLLNLPIIVVIASRLGAINHTLLTIRCAQTNGIEVRGVILNYPALSLDEAARTNRQEIKRLTDVPILGELPFCDEGRVSKMVKKYLDISLFLR